MDSNLDDSLFYESNPNKVPYANSVQAVRYAKKNNINYIIQLGDFGFWPGLAGIVFLDRLNTALVEEDITFIWLDGNHEWFDGLDALVGIMPKNEYGQTYIRSNILYSPRGCVWSLAGKKLMTVGGAVSIDRASRIPGVSWWPQEQLTENQARTIIDTHGWQQSKIDYLFTHEAHPASPFKFRLIIDPESESHRERMGRVIDAVRPVMHFHGHYHGRMEWTLDHSRPFSNEESQITYAYGLACNGMPDNWGILDTTTNKFVFNTDMEK